MGSVSSSGGRLRALGEEERAGQARETKRTVTISGDSFVIVTAFGPDGRFSHWRIDDEELKTFDDLCAYALNRPYILAHPKPAAKLNELAPQPDANNNLSR